MRLNILAWDTSKEEPELISDYWQPMVALEDSIKALEETSERQPGTRGLIIDWATRKVIVELKGKEIIRYKDNIKEEIRNLFKNLY